MRSRSGARLEAERIEAECKAIEERAEADRMVALCPSRRRTADARYGARKARQKKR